MRVSVWNKGIYKIYETNLPVVSKTSSFGSLGSVVNLPDLPVDALLVGKSDNPIGTIVNGPITIGSIVLGCGILLGIVLIYRKFS